MVNRLNNLILTLRIESPVSSRILKQLKPWDIDNLRITCSNLFQSNLLFLYCSMKGHRIWAGKRIKSRYGHYSSYDHNCFCGFNGPGPSPPKNLADFFCGLYFYTTISNLP